MKLRKLLIIAFTFIFVSLFALSFKVSANTVETSELITVQGAQIRTTGNAGIRFVAKEEYAGANETAWGIILAYGEAEANEEFVIDGTVNGKEVLKGEVVSTREGVYTVTLYNVPEEAYTQVVTARAYVIDGENVVYSQNVAIKSLAEVALKAKNDGNDAELVNTVVTAMEGYKKVFQDPKNNFYIDSALYETNYSKLAIEFVKDWNACLGTELDSATCFIVKDYDCPFKGTATGSVATKSGLYKFFSDETYRDKWAWFLDFLYNTTDNSPAKQQIKAIKDADDTLDSNTWYSGISVVSLIASTFNAAKVSAGAANIDYTSKPELLANLQQYNNAVYADLAGVQIVKVGDEITTPSFETSEGYKGIFVSTNETVEINSEYTVPAENIMFVATPEAIEYTIKFIYEDSEINELATSYTIEAAKVLPIFNLDGYAFKAWYDNEELQGEPITEIAKGSIGNKVYYAEMVEVAAGSTLIEYVHCDYGFEQLRDEFVADWMTYSDSGKRVFDMTNTPERTTTYAQWVATKALFGNATFRSKYDSVITEICNVIYAKNPYYKSQVKDYLTNGVSAWTSDEVAYHVLGELIGFWNQTKFLGTATFWEGDMHAWTVESTYSLVKEMIEPKYTVTQELSTIGADLIVPVRPGYTFIGWYSNAEYTGETITTVSTEHATLYAKWEAQ